jgi:integrase
MAIIALTDLALSKLPFGPQYAVWDESLPTFGVRIGRRSKTFVLKQRNRYFVLGRYPIIRLKEAREEARRRLALKYFPAPAIPTKTAIEQFLAAQMTRVRPASYAIFQYHLHEHFPTVALVALTPPDIRRAISSFSASKANKAFMTFRAFLNWCVQEQYLSRNPIAGLKLPHKTSSRERVLSDAEVAIILRATEENTPFNNIVQFLIFSGQRRTQVARLQRCFVNDKDGLVAWPSQDMKTGQPHTIPITDRLRALIERGPAHYYAFVEGSGPFTHWDRAKKDLDARVKLPHWTLHDLRRTARTNLARMQVPENIAERILAHAPSKMNSIYNRYAHLPEMKDALLKLEGHYMRSCSEGLCGPLLAQATSVQSSVNY